MEDLWCVQNSGIELDDYADMAEYKRFLERFGKDEEQGPPNKRLLGETVGA